VIKFWVLFVGRNPDEKEKQAGRFKLTGTFATLGWNTAFQETARIAFPVGCLLADRRTLSFAVLVKTLILPRGSMRGKTRWIKRKDF